MDRRPTPATELSEPARSHPGVDGEAVEDAPTALGRFRLEEVIGIGGMGRVYRAWDPTLERHVAVKLLLYDNPSMLERFMREARAQARVQHEHVCQVYEVGQADGRPYIAMQLVRGVTLVAAARAMPLEEKLRLFVQVADAVHAAHRTGLVHRDLKPSNIMVESTTDGRWHPWVMDFGIARELAGDGLTATGVALGTPAYMAPEQASGQPGACDRRTDVYGLGATLYEAVTSEPPFDGATGVEILIRVASDEPRPPRSIDPSIPRDLETIILKCLEKDPEHRYPSARALADDLLRLLDGDPILARRARWDERVVKAVRKHRLLAGVIASATVAVMVMAAVAGTTAWRARERAQLAQRFGQDVTAMETTMRVASLLPLHDIRPEVAHVREQMADLSSRMEELGAIARAPGSYALGRGHLALREYREALSYLETAWQEGYRSGDAAFALGVARGEVYRQELAVLGTVRDAEQRKQRELELEARYRDPALEALHAATSLEPAARSYVEGLIAFFEGRYDDALAAARTAAGEEPALYEALQLAGDVRLAVGERLASSGRPEDAAAAFDEAGEDFARAAEVARSDPAVYVGQCRRWSQRAELDRQRGVAADRAIENGRAACGQSLVANPDNDAALIELSRLSWREAEAQMDRGEDPRPALTAAIATAERAVELKPASAQASSHLGVAFDKLGLNQMQRGIDPGDSFQRAISAFDRAVKLDPSDYAPRNNRGLIWWRWGQWQAAHGEDPLAHMERAADDFRAAVQLRPSSSVAHGNLGLVRLSAGMYLARSGRDPREALADAVAALDHSLELNPRLAVALNSLGAAHWTLAEWLLRHGEDPRPELDLATAAFAASARENPTNQRAHNNLGSTAASRGEYEMRTGQDPRASFAAAIEHLDRALELNPGDITAAVNRARVHRLLATARLDASVDPRDEIAAARADLATALRTNPSFVDALAELASVELVEARRRAAAGLAPDPAVGTARRAAGEAVRLAPERPDARLEVAEVELWWARHCRDRGSDVADSLARGLEAADAAIAANPEMANAHATRAALLLLRAAANGDRDDAAGDAAAAVAALGTAIELDPLSAREHAGELEAAQRLAAARTGG